MNDFVNPQHRGVNLPAGYKDLMDVLEAKKQQSVASEVHSPVKIERIISGGLAHVEKHLQHFLMYPAVRPGPFLFFETAHRGMMFNLLRVKKGPHAIFVFPPSNTPVERTVRKIFTNVGINLISDEFLKGESGTAIQCLFPNELPDLLRIVTTLLKEAYGVSEADGLSFIYRV